MEFNEVPEDFDIIEKQDLILDEPRKGSKRKSVLSQSLHEADSKGDFESQRNLEADHPRTGSFKKDNKLSDKQRIKDVLKPAIKDKQNFLKMFKEGIDNKEAGS